MLTQGDDNRVDDNRGDGNYKVSNLRTYGIFQLVLVIVIYCVLLMRARKTRENREGKSQDMQCKAKTKTTVAYKANEELPTSDRMACNTRSSTLELLFPIDETVALGLQPYVVDEPDCSSAAFVEQGMYVSALEMDNVDDYEYAGLAHEHNWSSTLSFFTGRSKDNASFDSEAIAL